MSSPPYTTILLQQLCTVSTGLAFLYQRQCPHHHIPLFQCIHCILHPLFTASTGLTFLHQRQCPHHHIPLFHCVHCILCPLRTASTPSSHLCVILTQPYISLNSALIDLLTVYGLTCSFFLPKPSFLQKSHISLS